MSESPDKKLVHSITIPIRWGDMDAFGHVNNTVYFRYMEQARVEWLAWLGCIDQASGQTPVVVNAFCNFRKPLTYPGMVEVCTYIGQIGRSSVETFYELRLTEDGFTVYADGGAKIVWMDNQTGKSVALPENLKSKLSEIAARQLGPKLHL